MNLHIRISPAVCKTNCPRMIWAHLEDRCEQIGRNHQPTGRTEGDDTTADPEQKGEKRKPDRGEYRVVGAEGVNSRY